MQQNEENVLDKKLIWLYSVLIRNALGGETMNINARVADIILAKKGMTVSYTHLTLPTTPYV